MKRQGLSHGKLFSTLVLMSSTLTLGCAGQDLTDGDQVMGSGGAGGQENEGSGGSTSGESGASGGDSSGDGGTGGSTGGAGGNAVDSGPFDCPPQQLECSTNAECFDGQALVLPNGCSCNEERPLVPEDCGEGERMFCLHARANEAGQNFTEDLAFQCECVPDAEDQGCVRACGEFRGVGYAVCRPPDESELSEDEWSSVLCGCAVTILR